jgi:hypothetical protein
MFYESSKNLMFTFGTSINRREKALKTFTLSVFDIKSFNKAVWGSTLTHFKAILTCNKAMHALIYWKKQRCWASGSEREKCRKNYCVTHATLSKERKKHLWKVFEAFEFWQWFWNSLHKCDICRLWNKQQTHGAVTATKAEDFKLTKSFLSRNSQLTHELYCYFSAYKATRVKRKAEVVYVIKNLKQNNKRRANKEGRNSNIEQFSKTKIKASTLHQKVNIDFDSVF